MKHSSDYYLAILRGGPSRRSTRPARNGPPIYGESCPGCGLTPPHNLVLKSMNVWHVEDDDGNVWTRCFNMGCAFYAWLPGSNKSQRKFTEEQLTELREVLTGGKPADEHPHFDRNEDR